MKRIIAILSIVFLVGCLVVCYQSGWGTGSMEVFEPGADIHMYDNYEIMYGNDKDFYCEYDSVNNRLEWDRGNPRENDTADMYLDASGNLTCTGNVTAAAITGSGDLTVSGVFICLVSSTAVKYTAPVTTGSLIIRSDNFKVYVCTGTKNPDWQVVGSQS